jgi:regulator of sigma E protease
VLKLTQYKREKLMSIVIMILLLSLLILVHEAGHFFAARVFGIKVDKFGFGLPIGPTLYKTKCGDVEILVHAFLLGGYVSFPDDDKDCELPKDSPERFINKPKWQRAIVVSAGVIANVICALALVIFVAAWSKQLPSGNYEVSVSDIKSPSSTKIVESGLQKGDKIIKANGCEINNVYSFVTIVKNSAKSNGFVSPEAVEKNYETLKALNPGLERDEAIPEDLSVRLPITLYEDSISMDKYAAKGAKYFKKNGIPLEKKIKDLKEDIGNSTVYISDGEYTLHDIASALSDGAHPVVLVISRNGVEQELSPVYPDENGVLGISLNSEQTMIETKSLVSILKNSNKYLWDNTGLMMYSLGQLFTGNIPLKDMHGVVAITKIGGDIIQKSGATSGILLAALISMNLAILNILPIPALDGGHLMFLIIEKIIGKPLDDKIIENISTVFFMILVVLMVLIVFNDIAMIIKK